MTGADHPTIRLWVCEDCGDIVRRTQELPDGEAPNHHSVWLPYVAVFEDDE